MAAPVKSSPGSWPRARRLRLAQFLPERFDPLLFPIRRRPGIPLNEEASRLLDGFGLPPGGRIAVDLVHLLSGGLRRIEKNARLPQGIQKGHRVVAYFAALRIPEDDGGPVQHERFEVGGRAVIDDNDA